MSRQAISFVTGLLTAAAILTCAWTAWAQPMPEKKPGDEGKAAPAKKKKVAATTEVYRKAGELKVTDGKDPVRPGCYFHLHEVKMAPGKTYVIRLYDQNRPANMDPYLRLEDSKGGRIAEDDDGEGARDSRIEYNPTREETYRIYATTLGANVTGKYVLTVDACPPGRVPPRSGMFGGGMVPSFNTGVELRNTAPEKVDDLHITCLPWGQTVNPGNNYDSHGYVEYRFTIENRSETATHRVLLKLPSVGGGRYGGVPYLQSLTKAVEIAPRASAQVSVFQPDLAIGFAHSVDVEIDGRHAGRVPNVPFFGQRGQRSLSRFHGGGGPPTATLSVLVTPSSYAYLTANSQKLADGKRRIQQMLMQSGPEDLKHWSTHWPGYTSFDAVVLAGDRLQAAPAEVQGAIFQYVEAGGSLFLFGGEAKLPESWQRLKQDYQRLSFYYPGFGQCFTAKSLADFNAEQTEALMDMWVNAMAPWHQIASPAEANRALPVVDDVSIPLRGLFVAMILFVVLIGPVNIYWLARNRRRIWLLWTVPVFAALTCALLVAYMVATEGWHGHVRSTSITLLDEQSQRAATIGWIGYYCPTTPAGGLRFGLDTELTPHLNFRRMGYNTRGSQPCSIDWTHDQHLTDGWIIAKIPSHFMVRRNEKRLERLTINDHPEGKAAVNLLGAPIKTLWVARQDGTIMTAENIAPGANSALAPADKKCEGELYLFNELFAQNWVQGPEELTSKPGDYLRPGCYLAVLEDSPFLDQGLRRTQTRRMDGVVFGIMKEPF